ncbi:transcriptional regulator, XRE family [Acinetobacter baumannii 532279]|uniref:helix-turn-helix domain-containing protein n=1 Tax=Acinetobacter baumannii TaxID=470 RepID=UPI00044AD36E|nr:helix-turn-helix transcriptional regulator [Acinetobacter baumannii]EXE88959.1 transcriptional regulator, XRE family [Acinetobacter baumannii 532279]
MTSSLTMEQQPTRSQNRKRQQENLQQNLLVLVESCRSIADLCRRVDINRQQFNKYLSGQHVPSQKVLQKIGRYFMMEVADFFMPPAEFKRFYEGFENDIPIGLRSSQQFNNFMSMAKNTSHLLDEYLGIYHRYHNSSIYKGKILRSITYIYKAESLVQYVTIERFPLLDDNSKLGYSFKYHGFCFLLGDRIFMMDFEGKQNNEITFSILIPQHRIPKRFLYGIVSGVASTSYRQPFSTRLVFNFIERGPLLRRHLKACRVYDADDASIPSEVRKYFDSDEHAIMWGGDQ